MLQVVRYSVQEMCSVGRWYLKGPSILLSEKKAFDKVYSAHTLDPVIGKSVTLYTRDEDYILRDASWWRGEDVNDLRTGDFANLTNAVKYFKLCKNADDLVGSIDRLMDQIEEKLRSPLESYRVTSDAFEYSQFRSSSNRTSLNSWLLESTELASTPWQSINELLHRWNKLELPPLNEGYFFEPFGDLVTLDENGLSSLPAGLVDV